MSRLKTVDAIGLTTIAYQYDAMSNRTQMTDETGTSTYQYDGLGRLTHAAQPNGTHVPQRVWLRECQSDNEH
jgi:YD repeat-containing protein